MHDRLAFLGSNDNQYRHDLLLRDIQQRTRAEPLVAPRIDALQESVSGLATLRRCTALMC